jgi:hypothetical protein
MQLQCLAARLDVEPYGRSMNRRFRLLVALVSAVLCSACSEPAPPRHAVLLLIDTLRADAIEHASTPNLDALFERGQEAELAWSASTWTIPSVLSLLTGSHVREHGWDHRGRFYGMSEMTARPTLAQVLADEGFATVALYGNPILQLPIGYERGFERFLYIQDPELPAAVASEVARWNDGRRRFLYVHLMGPHEPLLPSPAARKRMGITEALPEGGLTIDWAREERPPGAAEHSRELYRRAYWAALEDTDERVGEILRALDPHLDEIVLIFTSDHGEMLGERNQWGHDNRIDEPLTRVPFLGIHTEELPPFVNGAAVPGLLTRALGVSHEWSVGVDASSPLISQRRGQLALTRDGETKGTWSRRGRLKVWDIADYPARRRGSDTHRPALRAERAAFQASVPDGSADTSQVPVDEETREALRRIGYLDDDAETVTD